MQKFIGIKEVMAEPLAAVETTHPDYLPAMLGQTIGAEGYKVQYADGYTSWSPKGPFEAANVPVTNMSFEAALTQLKKGGKISRKGWLDNFVYISQGAPLGEGQDTSGLEPAELEKATCPSFCVTLVDRETLAEQATCGWMFDHSDIYADDWYVWTADEAAAIEERNNTVVGDVEPVL